MVTGDSAHPAEGTTRTPPRRRGGRCFLWGCGGCLLLIVLLLAGGGFAYVRYGAPWLETQKSRLSERFPALRTLLRLKDASGLLRGVTLRNGVSGSTDPSDFPDDIWLPPEAEDASFSSGDRESYATLTVGQSDPVALAGRYRTEMAVRDWQRVPIPDPRDAIALLFEKDGRRTQVEIIAGDPGTEVWIRSQRSEGSKASHSGTATS